MDVFNHVVLILHFIGLVMGTSVSIGNIVMMGLIGKAAPADKAVLGRFMPAISKVGRGGLALLWVTGLIMVNTRWNGIASMPGTFHAKLTAVVLLTIAVGYATVLEGRISRGDTAAMARIQVVGKTASLLALTIVILAVLTFD